MSIARPAEAAVSDDDRRRLGPSVAVVEAKLRSPSARPGTVSRHALVNRLVASAPAPVICVVAPPGYGKTTLLAQWSERKEPRVAWVSVDRRDNDPVVLLSSLAAALDRPRRPDRPISVCLFDGAGQSRPARDARALRLLTLAQGWARVSKRGEGGE